LFHKKSVNFIRTLRQSRLVRFQAVVKAIQAQYVGLLSFAIFVGLQFIDTSYEGLQEMLHETIFNR